VPALAPHALDALGCGDALLAAATLTMAASPALSDTLTLSALIASLAAAAEAVKLGNEPISARDLRQGARRLADSKLSVITAKPGVRLVV
jgi:bifunctional ADP-heptose synthase (sugar kinase/adenylyltransferase)